MCQSWPLTRYGLASTTSRVQKEVFTQGNPTIPLILQYAAGFVGVWRSRVGHILSSAEPSMKPKIANVAANIQVGLAMTGGPGALVAAAAVVPFDLELAGYVLIGIPASFIFVSTLGIPILGWAMSKFF